MSMTLTQDDMAAISKMISNVVGKMIKGLSDSLETRLIARIDDLDDALSIQTEWGLQEVRDQVTAVKEVVDRIDRVQQAEMERNDRQGMAIHRIRESSHAA